MQEAGDLEEPADAIAFESIDLTSADLGDLELISSEDLPGPANGTHAAEEGMQQVPHEEALLPDEELAYLVQLQEAFQTRRTLRKRQENVDYTGRQQGQRRARAGGAAPARGTARGGGGGSGSEDDSDGGGADAGRRKGRVRQRAKAAGRRKVDQADLEAQVAYQVGLPQNALAEEEEEVLPPAIITRQDRYIEVRNHVLTLWRLDVNRFLSKEEAGAKVMRPYKDLVPYAWDFLNTSGFINFGINLPANPLPGPKPQEAVIVIGAGLAGASAACQLHRWGYRVLLLEGRNRPGGRVYTARLEGPAPAALAAPGSSSSSSSGDDDSDGRGAGAGRNRRVKTLAGAADLGGSIITGIYGNPLAVLARQLDVPMHGIDGSRCPLHLQGGGQPSEEVDELAAKQHDKLLEDCDRYRDDMRDVADIVSLGTAWETLWNDTPKGDDAAQREVLQHLMHWHLANLEFSNAACVDTLSLRDWDQDDGEELQGEHVFLPGGNLRLVEGLLTNIPILYNAVVTHVDYSAEEGVAVQTSSGASYAADAVVVTVPLGVLKRGSLAFTPSLPQPKLDAIRRLGFGILNKLVLLFPYNFWDADTDLFGHVSTSPDPSERGLYYLFYQYAGICGGGAVLAALVAGEAAKTFESTPMDEAVARMMRVLRDMFPGVDIPDPIDVVATRWGSDPLSYGSYSSVAVGSVGGEDYDAMAEPVAGRVFFAGEATIKKWPATMHGAFLSGLREAARVVRGFRVARKARKHGRGRRKKEEKVEEVEVGSSSSGKEEQEEQGSEDEGSSGEEYGGGGSGGRATRQRSKRRRRSLRSAAAAAAAATAGDGGGGRPNGAAAAAQAGAQQRRGIGAWSEDSDSSEGGSGRSSDDGGGRAAGGPGHGTPHGAARVAADVEAARKLARTAAALERLFRKHEPDLEFGAFAAFLPASQKPSALDAPKAPPAGGGEREEADGLGTGADGLSTSGAADAAAAGVGSADLALVRVELSHVRNAPRTAVHLALLRTQVEELRDVRGGDEARLALLSGDMGVKLLGRQEVAQLPGLLADVARGRGLSLEELEREEEAEEEGEEDAG